MISIYLYIYIYIYNVTPGWWPLCDGPRALELRIWNLTTLSLTRLFVPNWQTSVPDALERPPREHFPLDIHLALWGIAHLKCYKDMHMTKAQISIRSELWHGWSSPEACRTPVLPFRNNPSFPLTFTIGRSYINAWQIISLLFEEWKEQLIPSSKHDRLGSSHGRCCRDPVSEWSIGVFVLIPCWRLCNCRALLMDQNRWGDPEWSEWADHSHGMSWSFHMRSHFHSFPTPPRPTLFIYFLVFADICSTFTTFDEFWGLDLRVWESEKIIYHNKNTRIIQRSSRGLGGERGPAEGLRNCSNCHYCCCGCGLGVGFVFPCFSVFHVFCVFGCLFLNVQGPLDWKLCRWDSGAAVFDASSEIIFLYEYMAQPLELLQWSQMDKLHFP